MKAKHLSTRTHNFKCNLDRKLFERANAKRTDTWPNIVESALRATELGVDIDFLREIAAQAIIALENRQLMRYKLVARRLRKALNMVGASNETMFMASEAVYVRPVPPVPDGKKK